MKQRYLLHILLFSTMLTSCHSSNITDKKETAYHCRNINYYDYTKPVPYTEEAIDASYYANTFFAGDSRMGSLYLYTPLKDYGAEVWYCESMSLYRIYDMLNPDMFEQFQENTLYSLLTTTQKKIFISGRELMKFVRMTGMDGKIHMAKSLMILEIMIQNVRFI